MRLFKILPLFIGLSSIAVLSVGAFRFGGREHIVSCLFAAGINGLLLLGSLRAYRTLGRVGQETARAARGAGLHRIVKLFVICVACWLGWKPLEVRMEILASWLLLFYFLALTLETVLLLQRVPVAGVHSGKKEV